MVSALFAKCLAEVRVLPNKPVQNWSGALDDRKWTPSCGTRHGLKSIFNIGTVFLRRLDPITPQQGSAWRKRDNKYNVFKSFQAFLVNGYGTFNFWLSFTGKITQDFESTGNYKTSSTTIINHTSSSKTASGRLWIMTFGNPLRVIHLMLKYNLPF